jgi:hypothetical protein
MHHIYEVLPFLLKISYSRRENFLLVGGQVVALRVLLWGEDGAFLPLVVSLGGRKLQTF